MATPVERGADVIAGLRLPHWPGWRHLPREPRDTLFQLAVIAWTVLPHFEHLPLWCSALTAVILVWRAMLALRNGALPGRWPVIAVLVVALGLTFWTERTLFGKEAGVTMLVVLMGLKTLELRARRDALVIFFLGFFLVLTHCLYSQSLLTALAMLVSTWGLLTALILANMPVGRPSLGRAGWLAARSALLGLPLMLVLFLLFPRFGPLWGLPQDGLGRTGLSGTLRMGGVAELANDDSIAFRVRFDGTPPPPEALYFRGPVLTRFDGKEWRQSPLAARQSPRVAPEYRLAGSGQPYEMLIEPIRLPLLPLLELTPDTPGAAPVLPDWPLWLSADLQWRTDRLVGERLRLRATAWPRFEHGPMQIASPLGEHLLLPDGFNGRTLAWARRTRAALPGADARTLAAAVQAHVRQSNYVYTLQPGEYGRDAIDEFWLDRREGFCEHFATAFVVIMRAMGVPARLVTGYQGAEAPDADGFRVVRQSHAHAWAEYWQAGVGWLRADPTSAVAPERVRNSQALAPRAGLVGGALQQMSPALALRLRRAWELLDSRWGQWVMGYSRSRQFDLLERLGFAQPDWMDLARVLIVLLTAAASVGAVWAWLDRRRQDPWQRLHERILAAMARAGVPAQRHQAPRALAEQLRRSLGSAGDEAAAALLALERGRYGPGGQPLPGRPWWPAFERALAAARSAGAPPRQG